ncbi:MFS transporter [Dehalococcoidia bacterium]|nr:MFS transporter [Dehalococcoidia bacterium]
MDKHITTRSRFHGLFFGWVVVGVVFAITFTEGAFRGSILSIFVVPMAEGFGTSRSALTGSFSLAAIVASAIAPVVGPIVDHRGPRGVVAVGIIVSGLALIALAFAGSLLQYYIAFTIALAVARSVVQMGSMVAVANWFISRRGRAIAISSVGSRVSIPIFIVLAQILIETYSWRAAWFAMGAIRIMVALPPTLLFLRRRPEDIGLYPDGEWNEQSDKYEKLPGTRENTVETSWSLKEAMRTRALWSIVLATSLAYLAADAVNVHAFASFTDRGLSTANAAAVVSFGVLVTGAASIFWGFVMERMHIRYAAAMVFASGALGMAAIIQAHSLVWAYTYGLFYGISFGGARILGDVLYADYFGRASLGTIRGFAQPFTMAAMALGPALASGVYDLRGSYLIAFITFLLAYILAAMAILLATPPKKQCTNV